MTHEEAIKQLTDVVIYYQGKCTREALDIAINAIKKQIPMKPIIDEQKRVQCVNEHNIPVLCRNRKMPFCPFCGQKIDWGVSE